MRCRHRAWLFRLLVLSASCVAACATFVDLDVSSKPPDTGDNDSHDGGADAASDPAAEGGVLRVDASDAALQVPPAVCSCPADDGCCAPQNGPGVCSPLGSAASCAADGGLFLTCAGGDVANGRVCCFAPDRSGTSYAATCVDAGGQVCSDQAECTQGICTAIACRAVSLKVCLDAGEALPSCPP